MAKKVKEDGEARGGARGRTRVSRKHQVTIPAAPFHGAGLSPGDTLQVRAHGAGRVVLTRVDELVDRYAGMLDSGGRLRSDVGRLKGEWP